VILSLQRDTIARHQFTIFVEDAQEYAPVFTSSRRHFCKQKIGGLQQNMSGKDEDLMEPPDTSLRGWLFCGG
jgi:hypothetical protein